MLGLRFIALGETEGSVFFDASIFDLFFGPIIEKELTLYTVGFNLDLQKAPPTSQA